MAKKVAKEFSFRITDIRIVQFSQFDLLNEFDTTKSPIVEYQTKFNFKVLEKENKIGCLTNVKIKVIETDEYFADVKIETLFEINPFDEAAVILEDGNYNVNNQLLFTIASASIGTLRGILYERFKGSIIQKEIYPLTDLSQLFPSDKITL